MADLIPGLTNKSRVKFQVNVYVELSEGEPMTLEKIGLAIEDVLFENDELIVEFGSRGRKSIYTIADATAYHVIPMNGPATKTIENHYKKV